MKVLSQNISFLRNKHLYLVLVSSFLVFSYLFGYTKKVSNIFHSTLAKLGVEYKNFVIHGSANVKIVDVADVIPTTPGVNLFNINLHSILKKIYDKSWVSHAMIYRVFPNTILVKIIEKTPVACWQYNDKVYLIDEFGNDFESILPMEKLSSLLCVFGQGANLKVKQLQHMLQLYPAINSHIYAAVCVGNRRWDIILNNGTIFKMPEEKLESAFDVAQSLIKNKYRNLSKKSIDTVDLRNIEKVYIKIRKSKEIN